MSNVDVSTAPQKIAGEALLVCGYENDAKCRKSRLEGSMRPLAVPCFAH